MGCIKASLPAICTPRDALAEPFRRDPDPDSGGALALTQQGPACPPGLPGLSHVTGRDVGVPGPWRPLCARRGRFVPGWYWQPELKASLFQKHVHSIHSAAGKQSRAAA